MFHIYLNVLPNKRCRLPPFGTQYDLHTFDSPVSLGHIVTRLQAW